MREPLRDPERLRHIQKAIERIEQFTQGMTLKEQVSEYLKEF